MRIFAGDAIRGLAILAQALPAPWVLPNAIGERHRDRLVGLLHRALQGARPELRMIEIQWGERDLVSMGRIKLPPAIMIRWRLPALLGIDRTAVMREAQRISPEPGVFDFGRTAGTEILAWLGPLKQEVLRRLIDALEEHPPVGETDAIEEYLQNLAGRLRSPVDLIDAVEIMVEQIMLGQTVRSAHAEACARIVAARFDDEERDMDAAVIVRALVQVTGKAEISAASRALLDRAGLTEPGTARPLPLADLLDVDSVMERTQRLIVARFPLRERIAELLPDIPVIDRPRAIESANAEIMTAPRVDAYEPFQDLNADEIDRSVEPAQPQDVLPMTLREARTRVRLGDLEGAAMPIFEAIQSGRTEAWGPAQRLFAAGILHDAAGQLGKSLPLHAPRFAVAAAWEEASADICLRIGRRNHAAINYMRAAQYAGRIPDVGRVQLLLERGLSLADKMDGTLPVMAAQSMLGDTYKVQGKFAEAERAYKTALKIAREHGALQRQADIHMELGELFQFAVHDPEEARRAYDTANSLYQAIDDKRGQAQALYRIAFLHHQRMELESAIQHYTQALESWPDEDAHGKAMLYYWLGMARNSRDDFADAYRNLAFARDEFAKLGDSYWHVKSLYGLANLYLQRHELTRARPILEAALEIGRATQDEGVEAEGYNEIGHVQRWMGDLQGAARSHERALEFARATGDEGLEAQTLISLGDLHLWTGDLQKSGQTYEQARALYGKPPTHPGVVWAQLKLAAVHVAGGNDDHTYLDELVRQAAAGNFPVVRECARLVQSAAIYSSDPEAALGIWAEVAGYLRSTRRKAELAQVDAMIAVARGQPVEPVIENLRDVLGTLHPLPERLRQAPDAESRMRTILPFVFT